MMHYLTILRPLNGVMSMLAVWIGTLVAGASYVPGMATILGALSVFLISGAGMAINDYHDAEIDRTNKPKRPIPSGKISENAALAYSAVLTAAGVALAFMISLQVAAVAIAAAAILFAYAARLKKTILLGNVTVSVLVALTFVYGGMIMNSYVTLLPLALLAFLSNVGREVYKTIDDAVGDRKYNVNSVAIKLGVIHARLLGNIFLVLAIIFSFTPYFFGIFGETYLFFVLIADVVFLAATISPAKYGSRLIKAAMLLALVAFIAGGIKI